MSDPTAYAPKHRGAPQRPVRDAQKKLLKTTLLLSTLAVAGTGTAVVGGIVLHPGGGNEVAAASAVDDAASFDGSPKITADPDLLAERRSDEGVSRSSNRADTRTTADRRSVADPSKEAALGSLVDSGSRTAASATENLGATGDPKAIASALLASYGWDGSQFGCLVNLWDKESGWRTNAANPSGAYGIPQALPGSKMASAGPDWETNAETQIKWGLGYIKDRYGSPCGAWGHSESNNWY